MTVATDRLHLEDYIRYNDGTNTRYELVCGELVKMAIGSGRHGEIADFLNREFRRFIKRDDRPWVSKQMAVGVQSPRGGRWETVRIPDVIIVDRQQWLDLQEREAIICLGEPPPLLVVEVVSPSTQQVDYRAKRVEYSVLNIPEYWIVDPLEDKVTVWVWIDADYEATEFRDNAMIVSPIFPRLELTAQQVLYPEI